VTKLCGRVLCDKVVCVTKIRVKVKKRAMCNKVV